MFDLCSKRFAYGRQLARVTGEVDGSFDVIIGRRRGQMREAGMPQKARPNTRHRRFTGERDGGHAHPKGMASRGVPIKRERVQRDVDAIQEVKEFAQADTLGQIQAIRCYAVSREAGQQFPPHRFFAESLADHQQSRVGCGMQNATPEFDHGRRCFRETIEGPKRDSPIPLRGERSHRRRHRRRCKTAECPRQAQERFGAPSFGQSHGINNIVGDSTIHRLKPGRAAIAEIAKLNRRRFEGKCAQSIALRMNRQVNKEVNAVSMDAFGKFIVRQLPGFDPVADRAPHAVRGRIIVQRIGVTEHFKLAPVVMGEDRLDEKSDGMFAEIGRHIADAQSAVGIAIICEWSPAGYRRTLKRLAPFMMFDPDDIRGGCRRELQRIKEVAECSRRIRMQLQCGAIVPDCFVHVPEHVQGIGQIVLGVNILWSGRDDDAKLLDRLGMAVGVLKDASVVGAVRNGIRTAGDRGQRLGGGLAIVSVNTERDGVIVVNFRDVGVPGRGATRCFTQGGDRLGHAAGEPQCVAKAVPCGCIIWAQLDGALIVYNCFGEILCRSRVMPR